VGNGWDWRFTFEGAVNLWQMPNLSDTIVALATPRGLPAEARSAQAGRYISA